MSDETPPAITDLTHKRDSDGNLLPVEKTVSVRSEGQAQVSVYPATAGQRNEWKTKLFDEDDELADDVRDDLFDEFLAHEKSEFGVESWDGLRPAIEDALANAIFDEIFDTDKFVDQIQEAIDERTGNPETAD